MCHRGGCNPNTNPTAKRVEHRCRSDKEWEGFSMTFRPNQAAIDEIVASCNGDLHGALQALLMVNEHLEAELAKLYAAAAYGGLAERGDSILH
jgi:hypothetical protein